MDIPVNILNYECKLQGLNLDSVDLKLTQISLLANRVSVTYSLRVHEKDQPFLVKTILLEVDDETFQDKLGAFIDACKGIVQSQL